MEMTYEQYIDNPMGKKNAVFSLRDIFKKIYTDKFDMILLREAGKINYTLYINEKEDRYIIHIKIPSETLSNFYYDAVIMFYSNDAAAKSSNTLNNYYVKFFSNDPAFVFTYLRVFLKNNLFFEDLKPKASKLALTKDPKITNAYETPGYSKILYFAYLYMKSKNLFNKSLFKIYGTKYDSKELLKNVIHTDEKISLRQKLGDEATKQKSKEKKQSQKISSDTTTKYKPSENIKISKKSNIISSQNVVKKTGMVKKIKKK